MTCDEALDRSKVALADLQAALATRWRGLWFVCAAGACVGACWLPAINGVGIAVLVGAGTFCWLKAGDYQREANVQRAVAQARWADAEAHWAACPTCRAAVQAAADAFTVEAERRAAEADELWRERDRMLAAHGIVDRMAERNPAAARVQEARRAAERG